MYLQNLQQDIYLDFLLVQLISALIEKHFDCLKGYKLNVLRKFSC